MKLFKLMATTAITTMAVAAMSVSASAALTATYTAPTADAAGSIALSGIETTAEQKTLLVLNNDATNVVEGDIVQIDQDAALTSVAVGDLAAAIDAANQTALDAYNAGEQNADTYATLTAAWKASTDYFVRVGGDGTIEKYTLTVNTTKTLPEAPAEVPDEPVGTLVEQGYGDLDESGEPDPYDAALIMGWYGYELDLADEQLEKGDIDKSGEPDPYDAALIMGWYGYELDDNFLPWE